MTSADRGRLALRPPGELYVQAYRPTRQRRDATVARLTVARKIGKRAFHTLRELELATT